MILLGLTSTALACGYCIEDKIAVVYDYGVVTHALSRHHQVVFFAVEGTIVPNEKLRRALKTALESLSGVDKGSTRVSGAPAAVSAAFDPTRVSAAAMEQALSRKLASHGLSITTLRVMAGQSALTPAGKP